MVVELRDRAATLTQGVPGVPARPGDAVAEAVSALQALGYKPAEAERMAKAASGEGETAEAIIRKALQSALR
jgi:Holliday junction DNA helicase RuvA